jgi:hypothetical protein
MKPNSNEIKKLKQAFKQELKEIKAVDSPQKIDYQLMNLENKISDYQIIFVGDDHSSTHSIKWMLNNINSEEFNQATLILENLKSDNYADAAQELQNSFTLYPDYHNYFVDKLRAVDIFHQRGINIVGGENQFSDLRVTDPSFIKKRVDYGNMAFYQRIKSLLQTKPSAQIIVLVGEKHIDGIIQNTLTSFPNVSFLRVYSPLNGRFYSYEEYLNSTVFLCPDSANKFKFNNINTNHPTDIEKKSALLQNSLFTVKPSFSTAEESSVNLCSADVVHTFNQS